MKKILIIVPHEDDEINLAGGLIYSLKNKDNVYVTFVTNGDFIYKAKYRYMEAIKSLGILGVKKDNIIFLGYADQAYDQSNHMYNSEKDWTFVFRKKIKTKYGENAAHINHVNKKALNYFQYYRLKIDCNGEMEFDTFCDSNQDEAEEWNKICYAYDFVEDKHRGAQNQVEGLMYSDIDNIHAILLTREKTLPNISALMNTLMETDAKERVSKELLLEAIDDFEKDNIDSRECISEWKSKVAAETEMITKKALKKILNMRTGIASKFNRFLHEKYGVWIDGELRKGEFEATYQIGNLLNIKYEYNEKDYLDGRTFVYYVGAKSKRLAYPNACCMRKVISLGEELEYEEALPLMAVEFVRNSQYTVLPFPFKYLREYIKQC